MYFFFQDPAVQQAVRVAPQTNILEDYNPFDEDNQNVRNTQAPTNQTQPTFPQSFPAYNQNSQTNSAYGSAAPQISTEELQVKMLLIFQKIAFSFTVQSI